MGAALLSAIAVFGLLFQQAPVRLYPVDDTSRDPAFRSYVGKLRSATDKRDATALRKLAAKDVFVGPDDKDKGWDKFVARWHPENRDSEVWRALSDFLTLGFVQEHPRLYLSPYLVWRYPDEVRIAAPLVVVKDKAALRDTPSPRGQVTAYLSFDIVQQVAKAADREELAQWVRVRTLDGKTGYVESRDVMSPVMPRAQFGFQDGRWQLTALERPEP